MYFVYALFTVYVFDRFVFVLLTIFSFLFLAQKIALAYSVEEEQLGWKASKKALLCVQKALERRDSILEKALKADDGNLLFVLRRTVDETNNNNNNIKETVKKTAREILKTYFENDDRNNNTSSSIFGGAAAATATATATTSNITNMLDSLNWS
jgi:hypothetical protein